MTSNQMRIILREVLSELWIKDPPVSIPIEQSVGWNNALAAFETKASKKLSKALNGRAN